MTDYLIVPETFGQGSFGSRCEVCDQTDYGTASPNKIEHLPGCIHVTAIVRALRDGLFEALKDESV